MKYNIADNTKIIKNLLMYKNKNLPYSFYTKEIYLGLNTQEIRRTIIKYSGYALLTWEVINFLSKFLNGNCLEIISGSGYLTWALKQKNINIIATDNFSWDINFEKWIDIEQLDAISAINKYGKALTYIIASWFPYDDNLAYECLIAVRKINPKCKMLIITESKFGCCANDKFFDNIEIINNKYIDEINNIYTSWFGIYDKFMLIK